MYVYVCMYTLSLFYKKVRLRLVKCKLGEDLITMKIIKEIKNIVYIYIYIYIYQHYQPRDTLK